MKISELRKRQHCRRLGPKNYWVPFVDMVAREQCKDLIDKKKLTPEDLELIVKCIGVVIDADIPVEGEEFRQDNLSLRKGVEA